MLRYYRIKAYLNASHFVVFDGKKGDTHPHTWEFVATVYTTEITSLSLLNLRR